MKKGFTLIEILITLAIVGIVAAMTIPTVTSSSKKQIWSSSLSKAVNTMSNSLSIMIMKDGAYGLIDSQLWTDLNAGTDVVTAFKDNLGKTMIFMDKYDDGTSAYTATPKTLYGTVKSDLFKDYTPLITKGNITYFVLPAKTATNNYEVDSDAWVMDVLIDVNGNDAPNTIGRDIFGFLVNDEGRMLAYGNGAAGQPASSIDDTSAGDSSRYENSWSDYCPDSTKTDSGFCCTGRLVKENYKMNY